MPGVNTIVGDGAETTRKTFFLKSRVNPALVFNIRRVHVSKVWPQGHNACLKVTNIIRGSGARLEICVCVRGKGRKKLLSRRFSSKGWLIFNAVYTDALS